VLGNLIDFDHESALETGPGRREAILARREQQKRVTLEERLRYNRSRSMTINLGELSTEP